MIINIIIIIRTRRSTFAHCSVGLLQTTSTSGLAWLALYWMLDRLTSWLTVLSQTLPHDVICILPVVANYSSLDTISTHMVVGLFLSRVRLPGTAWATKCVNRC